MNYGKRKAARQQKRITSKSAMQGKRVGVRLFKALLLCIVLVGVIGIIGGGLFVKRIINNAPEVSPSDVKPVQTVFTKQLMIFRIIWLTHLLQLRMNVFTNIMVSTYRVSPVQQFPH